MGTKHVLLGRWAFLNTTAALLLVALAPSVPPAITFNDTNTAIFGSGSPDTGWVSDNATTLTRAAR